MQTLSLRLGPDHKLVVVWLSAHGAACCMIILSHWPVFPSALALALLAFGCIYGVRRLLLRSANSIVAVQCTPQQWRVEYRNGETATLELCVSLITGEWVWLQFRTATFCRMLVLLTPGGVEQQGLRRLRVILRSR